MRFVDYEDVLEYNPDSESYDLLWKYDISEIDKLKEFCDFMKVCSWDNVNNYIVSLSGGVDSMLITCFLKHMILKNKDIGENKPKPRIIGAHINYHQRDEESNKEEEFIRNWCRDNDVIFEKTEVIGYNRRDSKQREDFETYATNKRYDFYKQLLEKYGDGYGSGSTKGIFLGHHNDDRAENIYTNIMHGRSIVDLSVLKPTSIIRSVPILRPLLGMYKPTIFEIAHKLNIPYFKDTTPDWSNRGILRRQIFPMFEKQYGQTFRKNLNRIGDQSDFMMKLIQNTILEPINKQIKYLNKDGFIIPFSSINPEYHNALVWNMIWENACHSIGIGRVGNRKLDNFLQIIKSADGKSQSEIKNKYCELNPDFRCLIDLHKKEIIFFNKYKFKNEKEFIQLLNPYQSVVRLHIRTCHHPHQSPETLHLHFCNEDI